MLARKARNKTVQRKFYSNGVFQNFHTFAGQKKTNVRPTITRRGSPTNP